MHIFVTFNFIHIFMNFKLHSKDEFSKASGFTNDHGLNPIFMPVVSGTVKAVLEEFLKCFRIRITFILDQVLIYLKSPGLTIFHE